MKVRFTINDRGELVSRQGHVLGKLTAMSIDFSPEFAPFFDQLPLTDLENVGDAGGRGLSETTADEGQTAPPENSGPSQEGGPGGTTAQPNLSEPVGKVWTEYVRCMEPRSRDLDPDTRKIINAALRVATVEECVRAIRGCRSSAFHMGSNDKRRKYNRLSQILKGRPGKETTRERIDFFLDLAAKSGVASGVTSADPARVSQAKRAVLDSIEFPHDEHAQRRGRQEEAWLRTLGITYDRENRAWVYPEDGDSQTGLAT